MKVNLQQILDLPPEVVKKLSIEDLRKVVKVLGHEANLRLQALENAPNGQLSPAYKKFQERGKLYGELSFERIQLIQEYTRLVDFLNMKTSTVKGWEEVQANMNMYTKDMTSEQLESFYTLFSRFVELHPDLVGSELSTVRQACYNFYQNNQQLDSETMLEEFERILDEFWAGSWGDVEDDFGY